MRLDDIKITRLNERESVYFTTVNYNIMGYACKLSNSRYYLQHENDIKIVLYNDQFFGKLCVDFYLNQSDKTYYYLNENKSIMIISSHIDQINIAISYDDLDIDLDGISTIHELIMKIFNHQLL